jgi:hypothetical protein
MAQFNVVCNETNNSPEDIQNNKLNVDVYINEIDGINPNECLACQTAGDDELWKYYGCPSCRCKGKTE